jgi:hypothetical protein
MNIRVAGALSIIVGVVCLAISIGGRLDSFYDFPSLIFLVGVTVAGTLLSFPGSVTRQALGSWFAGGALSEAQAWQNSKVFRHTGRIAMAAGLLGALVGFVQMLQKMDDPGAIGPAMAQGLLTVFYGLVAGEVFLRGMASDCLARGGVSLPVQSRRGSASSYLLLLGTLAALFCFSILLISMASFEDCSESKINESIESIKSEETSKTESMETE